MRKEDRFHPIITIVIYYNEKEWDGPHTLFDMMIELPPEIKDVFSNYKMNLLQVCKSGEYSFSNEDVQTVFQISRSIYEADFDEIKRIYRNRDIKAELAVVIGKITDSNYIINQATDGREVMNMCTALDNLRRQGVEEGEKRGERRGEERGEKKGRLETAKVSIKRGLPIDLIADITGLSIKEIEELVISEENR